MTRPTAFPMTMEFCLKLAGQEEKDAKPLPRINRHSVFWIVASVGLTYYFDFLRVITENGDIRRCCSDEKTFLYSN